MHSPQVKTRQARIESTRFAAEAAKPWNPPPSRARLVGLVGSSRGFDRIDVEPQVSTARPLNTLLTITASYDSLCVIQLNWAIYNYREALTDRDN